MDGILGSIGRSYGDWCDHAALSAEIISRQSRLPIENNRLPSAADLDAVMEEERVRLETSIYSKMSEFMHGGRAV